MKKLLLCEDDELLSMIVKKVLVKKTDLKVIHVSIGTEIMDAVHAENPDLILLDIMMPGIDGFEVLKLLKADNTTSTIPVIVMSCLEGDDYIKHAFNLGADEYFIKPFNTAKLLDKIDKYI